MMAPPRHRLLICTTCNRAGAVPGQACDGMRLYQAVQALMSAAPAGESSELVGVDCMGGCGRACTVGLVAPGKSSYLFGDLEPTPETAAAALALLRQYGGDPAGNLPRSQRPPAFRKGMLARLPAAEPAGENTADPGQVGAPIFDLAFQAQLAALIRWRRDVRRFRRDPLPPDALSNLLELADLAPSVGLSQPWRFVTVDDPVRRDAVRRCFARCNAEALGDLQGERAALYARLKLAGLDQAPCHLAVFAELAPSQGAGLGRRTMPETTAYSAVMAVHTLWLAARAVGLGLGWVSILDPATVTAALAVPPAWRFIGYFCIGYPEVEEALPELQRLGWEQRSAAASRRLQR